MPEFPSHCFNSLLVNHLKSDYYNIENILTNDWLNNFTILQLNIRSLPAHFNELLCTLRELPKQPDIIFLCETWLSDVSNSLYEIDGYSSFHEYRTTKNGGGVSLYINSLLNPKYNPDISVIDNNFEFLGTSLIINNKLFNILSCYRPPAGNVNSFIEKLYSILENLKGNVIIAGDQNICLLHAYNSNDSCKFLNLMVSNGFSLCNNRPTRINYQNIHNSSLIDHIWTNVNISLCKSYNLSNVIISDHMPIVFHIPYSSYNPMKDKATEKIVFRQFFDENISQFKNSLRRIQWDTLFIDQSIDDSFNIFSIHFYDIFNKCFPIKHKSITKKSKFCALV